MRPAVVALLAAFVLPAFAQSDAVIINATRFPEDVARFPASVTVLSVEDIRNSAARTLMRTQSKLGFERMAIPYPIPYPRRFPASNRTPQLEHYAAHCRSIQRFSARGS